MAKISKKGSKGHHTYTFNLVETSTSVSDNTSTMNYSFVLTDDSNYFWRSFAKKISYKLKANGSVIASGYIPNHTSKTETITSGTFTVPHDSDGNKTIDYSFTVTDNANQSYTSGNASASGTLSLSTIPRYLSIDKLDIVSKTETSAIISWATSEAASEILYSLDNGASWINSATNGEIISDDRKSGFFNIYNLNENTTYNLKIKAKRSDSGLYTESSSKDLVTYAYPYCEEAPDFIIGNKLILKIYNPLGRTYNCKIIGANNDSLMLNDYQDTAIYPFNNDVWINFWYSSIPNSKTGKYKVQVIYGNSVKETNGGNYSVIGTEKPVCGTITYQDSDSTVTAITQNNQYIVQNISNLKVSYTSATAKNSASIAKYTFELNGIVKESTKSSDTIDFGKVNVSDDIDLIMTVTDSRGLTTSTTKKVLILAHSDPTALVTLNRLNNYEDETYLTVDGSISSVNSKNSMIIKYRYKLIDGDYNDFITINDNTKQTLTLDKNNIYIFNILIVDSFGGIYDKNFTLNKGIFPLFIDTILNSVGINCFPTKNNSFEVNNLDLFSIINSFNNSIKGILLNGDDGLKINVKNYGSINKIPIIILGADSSNLIPVLTVVNIKPNDNFGYKNLGIDKSVRMSGTAIHIDAAKGSYYFVIAPPICEIELTNSAL